MSTSLWLFLIGVLSCVAAAYLAVSMRQVHWKTNRWTEIFIRVGCGIAFIALACSVLFEGRPLLTLMGVIGLVGAYVGVAADFFHLSVDRSVGFPLRRGGGDHAGGYAAARRAGNGLRR